MAYIWLFDKKCLKKSHQGEEESFERIYTNKLQKTLMCCSVILSKAEQEVSDKLET